MGLKKGCGCGLDACFDRGDDFEWVVFVPAVSRLVLVDSRKGAKYLEEIKYLPWLRIVLLELYLVGSNWFTGLIKDEES